MENRQYKPVSAILLALFSAQLLLPLVLALSVIGIRYSQENLIEKHRCDEAFFVKIPVIDISGFTQDEKEFYYNDTWYDAEGFIDENGETYVLAIADEKETHLAEINSAHISKSGKRSAVSERAPFFSFLFYEAPPAGFYLISAAEERNYNIFSPSDPINYVKDFSPPPRA